MVCLKFYTKNIKSFPTACHKFIFTEGICEWAAWYDSSQLLLRQLCAVPSYHWQPRSRAQHLSLLHPLPLPPKTQATAGSNEVTSWSPLFQSRQTKYPQPLLPGHISSPVISLIALNQTLTSFLYGGVQNCTQHWKWGCSSIKYSRKITYFDQLAVLSLPYPKMQFALFTAKVLLVHAKHSATCTPRSLPAVLPSSHSSPSLTCAWSCSIPNII